jgi:hypothetical protein
MYRSISMDLIRYIDRPTTIFGRSNFALLGRSKFPSNVRKLRMALKLGSRERRGHRSLGGGPITIELMVIPAGCLFLHTLRFGMFLLLDGL